jgi:flagellar biosynthesis repressor protein FlbT
MPLKLSLKPGERFVLNGAVVQNGDRRGVLILQNKASVLREKDIMQADEVTTPARRIYFPVMMMYLDESSASKVYDEFARRLSRLRLPARDGARVLQGPDVGPQTGGLRGTAVECRFRRTRPRRRGLNHRARWSIGCSGR